MYRIALVVALVVVCCPGSTAEIAATVSKPNVLFVMTDDMRLDDLQYMPHTRSLIGDQGETFDNYLDNVTLCCPARASILRGQYSHNTGIETNGGGNGGFETAYKKGLEQSTVATAMQVAGYTTGLFGKYLNGYPNGAGRSYIPPGWDSWSSSTAGNAYGEYDYTLNENGTQVQYGHRGGTDYGTNVYMRQALSFMRAAGTESKPFFAYVAVYAPHEPWTPAPADVNTFPGLQVPRNPSFNEADVSDKPEYIKQLPPITFQRKLDQEYQHRVESLQAVDRDLADVVDGLRASGQLDNTYIVFTSDNGFHLGEHRLNQGKQTAYETDIHLPLLVRGPGIKSGSHVNALAGNIDLAPTFAELAHGTMTDNPDGRSLVPFFTHPDRDTSGWRQAYLLEHWGLTPAGSQDRSGAAELEPPDDNLPPFDISKVIPGVIPVYQGLRLQRYTYVEYVTGERELYDLTKDPYELDNLASTADPALLAALHDRLDALRACAGDTCREHENAPLNLPS